MSSPAPRCALCASGPASSTRRPAAPTPSLKALVLTSVADSGRKIQRLISGCPFLADLTLEACARVTTLSVLDKRLRRLALRCCHRLASVIIDASELRAFEYRGAVPAQPSFKAGYPRLTLVQGQVDTHGNAVVAAVARILGHASNLEVLTLFFKAPPRDKPERYYGLDKEEEFLDAHHLKYDHGPIFPETPPADLLPPCMREINLVNYQGGDAQRKLAKFLLRNVGRLEALYCGFAEGPLWIQTKLMDEMRGWAMDKIELDGMMFM